MRRDTLILVLTATVASAAGAQTAEKTEPEQEVILELIEQNSGALTRALTIPSEIAPSRIWIHIRKPEQKDEAAKIADLLKEGVHLGPITRGVDLRPVQEVEIGPDVAQVRYFKREDQATAHEIARTLEAAGIPASSESFVEAFKDSSYIDVGHIEIWLPEDVATQ